MVAQPDLPSRAPSAALILAARRASWTAFTSGARRALRDRVARHTKAHRTGVKAERPNLRMVAKRSFKSLQTMDEVVEEIFGSLRWNRVRPPASTADPKVLSCQGLLSSFRLASFSMPNASAVLRRANCPRSSVTAERSD